MKLVARYSLILVGLFVLVLLEVSREGVLRQVDEAADETARDHEVLGAVLRTQIETDPDPAAGPRLLSQATEQARGVRGAPAFEWLDRERASAWTKDVHLAESGAVVSVYPVRRNGSVVGAVRLRESLDTERTRVHDDAKFALIRLAVLILGCALISVVVGRWVVAIPMKQMLQKARRTGHGDFSGPLGSKRTDEVGDLAREIDAMCEALSEGQSKLIEESKRRIAANDELRHAERLATAGKLAAGVAHELGTPLSVISGRAEMIAGGEVTGDKIKTSADTIVREAARVSRIVRQLLDFVRRKGSEGAPSKVATVVTRTMTLLEPIATKRRVKIETDIDETARVAVTEDSLQQILMNLAGNAMDAMTDGGTMTITTAFVDAASPRKVDGPKHAVVRLDVNDTGHGIPDDIVPHIFDPFFTTKAPGKGTGLGLSVIYGIVEDHEGWITVESSSGGTTMSVFLPRLEAS